MKILTGQTALVTGASAGIGEALARKLAAEGVNLVLVARSQEKLEHLANELSQKHSVRCMPLVADLSQPHCGQALLQAVTSLDAKIDILVNNAGFGTYGHFESISPEAEQDEIAVNVAALVDLTHVFLPAMLQRGKGAVLNIASTAAFQPVPYLAVYAATKSFVLSFSEALWAEYKERGVHVVALCPSAVETSFISHLGDESVRGTSVFSKTLTPEHVADQALVALRGKKAIHIVGIKNWLMIMSLRFAPRAVVASAGAKMMRPVSGIK